MAAKEIEIAINLISLTNKNIVVNKSHTICFRDLQICVTHIRPRIQM